MVSITIDRNIIFIKNNCKINYIFFNNVFSLVLDDLIAQEKTDEDRYITEVLETTCLAARYLKLNVNLENKMFFFLT